MMKAAKIVQRVYEGRSKGTCFRIEEALTLAKELYAGHTHWTGLTLFEHTLGVLEEIIPLKPDEDTVIACILHHALDNGAYTLFDLEEQFGEDVRSIVTGMHLMVRISVRGKRGSIEDLRAMLLSIAGDMRVIILLLATRCHCLRHVHALPRADATAVCKDILQIFAPIAARLGMYTYKHTMENLAFPVLYSTDSDRMTEQYAQLKKQHPKVLETVVKGLEDFLKEQGIDAVLETRKKAPYSSFLKMQEKSITHISDLYDLYAIRVIVDEELTCYQALGHLHRLGRPVPHRFKDYIAFPKPNGYQSLHTTLVQFRGIPEDICIEVQIRTKAMHEEAQYGIAAHWTYKDTGIAHKAYHHKQLQSLLLSQQAVDSQGEFSLTDHIYVLTPRGDIIELPEGATPLDFAFQVHTDVGLCYKGARVNGSMVAAGYTLENGDVVEILKGSQPEPSAGWMSQLKMSSSRAKLRRYFAQQQRPQFVERGKKLLNEVLEKRGLPQLDSELSILKVFDGSTLTPSQREDILLKIGQGAERASAILSHLDAIPRTAATRKSKGDASLSIEKRSIGIEDNILMPVRFGQCCKPHESACSKIVGVVSRRRDIVIHKSTCGNLKNVNPERKLKVWWE